MQKNQLFASNLEFAIFELKAVKEASSKEGQTSKDKAAVNKKLENVSLFIKSLKTLNQ